MSIQPVSPKVKTIHKNSTAKAVFAEKTKEIRTSGTLVQSKVGGQIKQYLETTDWKDGKETVTKIPLPSIPASK